MSSYTVPLFVKSLTTEQREQFLQISSIDNLNRQILALPNVISHNSKPFILIMAKPQPSKTGTRVILLIDENRTLYQYNLTKGEVGKLNNFGTWTMVECIPKRSLIFRCGKSVHKFTTKVSFEKLGYVLTDFLVDQTLPPHMTALLPLAEFKKGTGNADISTFGPLSYSLVSLIRSHDLTFLRVLESLPLPVRIIRLLARPLMVIFCHAKQIGYLLRSLISFYMHHLKGGAYQILRGETLVIGMLSAIRNQYMQPMLEAYYARLSDIIEHNNKFLMPAVSALRELSVPNPVRLCCQLLWQYTNEVFHDEHTAIQAISGFLLLRGIGPLFKEVTNAATKAKFSAFSQMINLIDTEETHDALIELMNWLKSLGTNEVEQFDNWGFNDRDGDAELTNLLKGLLASSEDLIKILDESSISLDEQPICQFINEVYDYLKAH